MNIFKPILIALLGVLASFIACSSEDQHFEQSAGSVVGSGGNEMNSGVGGVGIGGSINVGGFNQGGNGGQGGTSLMNGDECTYNEYVGVYENDHCLFCGEGIHLGDIISGFPMDPNVCWQISCQEDLGWPYYCFKTTWRKDPNTSCIFTKDDGATYHDGLCTEDGFCCYFDLNQGDVCDDGPQLP